MYSSRKAGRRDNINLTLVRMYAYRCTKNTTQKRALPPPPLLFKKDTDTIDIRKFARLELCVYVWIIYYINLLKVDERETMSTSILSQPPPNFSIKPYKVTLLIS